MRTKTYFVELADEQRKQLNALLKKGKHSSRKLNRVRILLLSERDKISQKDKTDEEVAKSVGVCQQTVYNIRKRFCQGGLEAALNEKPRSGAPPKLDAMAEAHAMTLACMKEPEGRAHWTMQMIADKLVELKYVESISAESVRLRLKKRR